jgi:hypothetical protein
LWLTSTIATMRCTPWKRQRGGRKLEQLGVIPEHESAVRRLMADARGGTYEALLTLEDAKHVDDAAVVMEGDYGGSIYLTCLARLVQCDQAALQQLYWTWTSTTGTTLRASGSTTSARPLVLASPEVRAAGVVTNAVWLHPELEAKGLRPHVEAVIAGERGTHPLAAPRGGRSSIPRCAPLGAGGDERH